MSKLTNITNLVEVSKFMVFGGGEFTPAIKKFLLLEDGFNLLLEDGFKLEL